MSLRMNRADSSRSTGLSGTNRGDARHAGGHQRVDVKAIRRASGMTQEVFANTYGFTLGALRDWEQGRKRPERTACVLLRVIAEAPETVARAVAGA